MILVDTNLLLYAEDKLSPHHKKAVAWWDECLSGTEPVCLCWPVLGAFIRLVTNPRIFERPLTRKDAMTRVQRWLDQPCTRIVQPTLEHWRIFREVMEEGDATANLIPDAHLGALAREYACVLYSSDRDFARFPSVDWVNPLADAP